VVVTPRFAKVSHISFSVRDAEATAAWWREVFAMESLEDVSGDGWRGIVLIHPETATIIEFQEHDANARERFDPRRTGFDHMGLLVSDRAQLVAWETSLPRPKGGPHADCRSRLWISSYIQGS
jgi:glyoxylase I family protein